MDKSSEIMTTENGHTSPGNLIALAIKSNASIESLEKLMDLQDRWDKKESRKKFLNAMAQFQKDCPPIMKSKQVAFGNTKYEFAPLGKIASEIKDSLFNCGLSYRWEIDDSQETIKVTCIVSHNDGHSEATTMKGNLDSSGSKNTIQQRGSTITYLRRYTLVGALGIATDDIDIDNANNKAKRSGTAIDPKKSQETLDEIKKEVVETKTSVEIKESSAGWVDSAVKRGITDEHLNELKAFIRARHTTLKEKNKEAAK